MRNYFKKANRTDFLQPHADGAWLPEMRRDYVESVLYLDVLPNVHGSDQDGQISDS